MCGHGWSVSYLQGLVEVSIAGLPIHVLLIIQDITSEMEIPVRYGCHTLETSLVKEPRDPHTFH